VNLVYYFLNIMLRRLWFLRYQVNLVYYFFQIYKKVGAREVFAVKCVPRAKLKQVSTSFNFNNLATFSPQSLTLANILVKGLVYSANANIRQL
jgi:hypothetical protein